MNTKLQKIYGTSDWSATGLSYSDEIQITPGDSRTATLSAQYPGSLKDAVAAAPRLGSGSELLPYNDLRLHKRTFTANGNTVSATFTYAAFGDDFPKYTLEATPESVSLLNHRDFANISDADRVIAQEYVNGGTDATAIYKNKKDNKLATSLDAAAKNSGDWEKTTLGALVGSAKSRAVKLARQGVKSLAGSKLTWTETKTTTNNNVPSRLGEKSSPRGDHPSGRSWKITKYSATELDRDDFGNRRYTAQTTWEASDAVAEDKD